MYGHGKLGEYLTAAGEGYVTDYILRITEPADLPIVRMKDIVYVVAL